MLSFYFIDFRLHFLLISWLDFSRFFHKPLGGLIRFIRRSFSVLPALAVIDLFPLAFFNPHVFKHDSHLFKLHKCIFVRCIIKRHRCSGCSGARCTADAVNVKIKIVWQFIVNDMADAFNIDSPCSQISGYDIGEFQIADLLHHFFVPAA